MSLSYLLAPFIAWVAAGTLKFMINSARHRRLTPDMVGYGGFPSNHSSIVCAEAALIGMKEGISHPAFGVAVTLAFIVILDAGSLRRQVGRHAETLNHLTEKDSSRILLRERIGHTPIEILGGVALGILIAYAVLRLALMYR